MYTADDYVVCKRIQSAITVDEQALQDACGGDLARAFTNTGMLMTSTIQYKLLHNKWDAISLKYYTYCIASAKVQKE